MVPEEILKTLSTILVVYSMALNQKLDTQKTNIMETKRLKEDENRDP